MLVTFLLALYIFFWMCTHMGLALPPPTHAYTHTHTPPHATLATLHTLAYTCLTLSPPMHTQVYPLSPHVHMPHTNSMPTHTQVYPLNPLPPVNSPPSPPPPHGSQVLQERAQARLATSPLCQKSSPWRNWASE